MKINEDLQLPSLNKSILNAITDATEIDSTGSNANGYWLKFKNGIMIQWGQQDLGNQTFTTDWWGFMKRSGGEFLRATFPLSFTEVPYCVINPMANTAIPMPNGTSATKTQTQTFGMVSPPSATASRHIYCSFIAIGKWK